MFYGMVIGGYLTEIDQVLEQVLLVAQLAVMFEMVHELLVRLTHDQSLVLVPFHSLLPLEIHQQRLRIMALFPFSPRIEHTTHQLDVVTAAQIVLTIVYDDSTLNRYSSLVNDGFFDNRSLVSA
jgi:hypothetical protein